MLEALLFEVEFGIKLPLFVFPFFTFVVEELSFEGAADVNIVTS